MNPTKRPKVDTPCEGAWYQEVNKSGFLPKKVDHKLRYKIKPDGNWEPIVVKHS